MKNVIANIETGEVWGSIRKPSIHGNKSGFDLARSVAEHNQKETGNKTVVVRILDYVDQYNGRDREHYSFDVVEIINVLKGGLMK